MIKLFTNTSFLVEIYRKKVFPLLFDMHYLKSERLLQYYELVENVSECDIVIFPIDYVSFLEYKSDLELLNLKAQKHKKPIWIYSAGDYGFTNYIKNSYTFRLGGFNSKLNTTSFILPSFINDPYLTQIPKGFFTLNKPTKPNIGFVGHAQSGTLKYMKESLNHIKFNVKRVLKKRQADYQVFYPSSIKRAYYLSALAKNEELNTQFILRTQYRAGVKTEEEKQQSVKVFYKNIYDNAYTFCSRGVGNFSVRFYETLAMGRIPILLNTDCRLPLEEDINWDQHCVIVPESQANTIAQKVLEFHNSKSETEFIALQKSNRLLWETKLVRDCYFVHIHDIFIKKLKN